MEQQIHQLEKEAYCAVLRAFKAQSDALSWEKESLITELRKDLRVSNDEHRELLVSANNDNTIHQIREWRQKGGHVNASHPINDLRSPTPLPSSGNPRMLQSRPTHVAPLHTAPTVPAVASRGRNLRQFPESNNVAHGWHRTPIPGSGGQLIGRKVLTRCPDDNNFYEAVITRYNPSDGRHGLMYSMNTPDQFFQWVNIMQIPMENIRWVNEDAGLSRREGSGERSFGAIPGVGRSSLTNELHDDMNKQQDDMNEQQDDIENMIDDIKILHTDTLIKQVEKLVASSNPDHIDIEKAKKMLKDHERALLDAIMRLT